MSPDWADSLQNLLDSKQWTIANISQIIGSVSAVGALFSAIWRKLRQHRTQQLLEKKFGSEYYLPDVMKNSIRYYVRPNCSGVDPSQEAEIRQVIAPQENLFQVIDRHLNASNTNRHLLLLGRHRHG
jgi:hypothetical protein